jgi:PAS domain S-box-containing protein
MDLKPTYEALHNQVGKLKENENLYRSIVETSPASIMAVRNGRFAFVNTAGARMLGFSDPDALVGKPVMDFIEPESEQLITERIARLENSKDNTTVEVGIVRQDGIRLAVESTSVSVSIGGMPTAVIIAQDITERKENEKRLKKMQFSIDNAMDPMAWIAPDGRYLYVNKAGLEGMNYTREEMISKRISDIDVNFPQEKWNKEYQELKKVGYKRIQTQLTDGEGKLRHSDITSNYVKFEEEEFICSFRRDITELKQAEQALAEQLEFEMLIAETSTKLANTEPELVEESINSTLQSIGQFLRTDRAFLAQFSSDWKSLNHTNVWAVDGFSIPPSLFELNIAADIPWVAQHIRNGGVIKVGPGLSGLPDEARELRKWLEQNGVTSGFVVPVQIEGKSIGMLGLDTIDQPRDYSQPIVERLKILANLIGATLQRVRSQQAIIEQLQFQDLISSLSATFIHIKASEIDKNIERGLQLVVQHLDLDRGNLFEFSSDHEKLTLTHSSAREGMNHSPRVLYSSHQPWFTRKLLDGEIIIFSQPTDLPNEAHAERKYLLKQGIQSAMVFPLEAAGVVQGGITLSSIRRKRHWPESLVQRCELLTQIFSNALLRKKADKKISETLAEIRKLNARIEQENIYLREEVEIKRRHGEIIGDSRAVRQMLSQTEQVAKTDSTVLILGETGTGKELLARAIHQMSSRHHRPMITVNCAALPASLIESEMFGRDKGAFTGALSGRTGRFEIAHGSTLFLDEIGELTPDIQMKLLRVLEEGHFERLGSNKTITVDVRIIAATNRDLVKMVHNGSFRRDLYYRLNVFPIRVPSLHDRIEDLEQLVWAFVKDCGDRMGKRIDSIPRKSIEALKRLPWRGNIRELRNVIEQSMIITKGKILKVQLPGTQQQIENESMLMKDVERNHLKTILKQAGWRVRGKDGAAEILGLKESTLRSRMKKLGIQRPEKMI